MRKPLAMTIASFALVLMSASHAAEQSADLHLSPQVRSLLQEEMREVARGTQTLAIALATADWKTLHDTAAKIRASYIMNKQLSAAQKRELEHALPAGFKQLDAEFHVRAQKLAFAAKARDHELAAFHYSRLVESCVVCHSNYAKARFPGFASFTPPAHGH